MLLLPLHRRVALHLNIVRSFLVSVSCEKPHDHANSLPQNAVKLPLRATAHVVSWKSENRSFISVTSHSRGAERLSGK